MGIENKINSLLEGLEDTKTVDDIICKFNRIGTDLDDPNYIGFSFHEDALLNWRLLKTLYLVIPAIDNFNSHKGSIYIKFSDGTDKTFSGETTPQIISWLVKKNG